MQKLGQYYSNGEHGAPVDERKALELYHRAASLGHCRSCSKLAKAYLFGELGLAVDMEEAKRHWVHCAKRGDAEARHNLGNIEFYDGNLDLAVRYYRISAAAGVKASADFLLRLLQAGVPCLCKPDLEESLRANHAAREDMRSDERDRYVDYLKLIGAYDGEEYNG